MAFIEVPRFPENVSFGFSGGPEYLTDVVVVNSGNESRNQVWSQARHKYDASHAARLPAQWQPLKAFFHIVRGRADGFRVKDWTDYQCPDSAGSGVIGQGFGTGYPTGQMGKKYTAGSYSFVRSIYKPITTVAPAIYKNGVLLVEGTGAGQETPDLSTGIVTFKATSTANIIGITRANPAVVTTSGSHGLSNGTTVYIKDVAGMTEVNGLAFPIAGVTPTTFQLSGINSSAYAAYVTLGSVSVYPQPADTLTWVGEFDVPCRFDTDQMTGRVSDRQPGGGGLIYDWESIPLIEIRVPLS